MAGWPCWVAGHQWKPRVRRLAKPVQVPPTPLILPFGFELRIVGFMPAYQQTFRKVGDQCSRCGMRKP